jgi:hypothetical protein
MAQGSEHGAVPAQATADVENGDRFRTEAAGDEGKHLTAAFGLRRS